MRVISLNVNGIRSAARKGLFDWLATQDADVICLQEIRAQEDQLGDAVFRPTGYHAYFHTGARKGYGGVAVYARLKPQSVSHGLGWPEVDAEGRYLELRFAGLSVVSLYVPSGSSGPERQAAKFAFMDRFMPYLRALRRKRRDYILCGDWNIAHKEIDLKNWRGNQKNSGFLPEERAWMEELFADAGYVDAFRRLNPHPEQYTWWSNRGQAWAKNVGWRIDYQVVTPGLRGAPRGESIHKQGRFSDHAPLTIDYELPLR